MAGVIGQYVRTFAEATHRAFNAQALAGHKSADMASVYRDVMGDERVKVKG